MTVMGDTYCCHPWQSVQKVQNITTSRSGFAATRANPKRHSGNTNEQIWPLVIGTF